MVDLDSIVIGAGTAGCVVARRLLDAGQHVCLIEAGPGEPRPPAVTGADPVAAAEALDRQWPNLYASASTGGRPYRYRQGFGIGGGSSINALILSPGDTLDYQRWVDEHGCTAWSQEALQPWMDQVTATWPSRTARAGPVTEAFTAAATEAGHPVGGNSLEPDRLGVLETRLSLVGDRRVSSFDHYLGPALDADSSDRLQLLTGRSVGRILTDGGQATGVVLEDGTNVAARRIVVCAGAVATPRLLQTSGVGRPSVGAMLRDHPSFVFTVSLKSSEHTGPDSRLISRLLRWSSEPNAGGVADLQAFVMERVDDQRPGSQPYAAVVVGLMAVSSVGNVARSAADGPAVITGSLSTEDDRRRLRNGVRHVGNLLASPAVRTIADQVFLDDQGTNAAGLESMSDARLDELIVANPGPYSHPATSCPMGPQDDPAAVVSHRPEDGGLVHGHSGVHVIDASIMPQLVRGGLQLPVTVLAERLAAGLVGSAS